MEKIQQEAVDQALQFVVDERLVEVRMGAGGHLREAPSDILVAKSRTLRREKGIPPVTRIAYC